MKVKIRNGTFETNSSSIHTINIYKHAKHIIPQHIHLNRQEFGWDFLSYDSCVSKANYLFDISFYRDRHDNKLTLNQGKTKFVGFEKESWTNKLVEKLQSFGCTVSIFWEGDIENFFDEKIDHINNAFYILEALLENDELLKNFLFSSQSFIATGNDNTYEDEDTEKLFTAVGNQNYICFKK